MDVNLAIDFTDFITGSTIYMSSMLHVVRVSILSIYICTVVGQNEWI